MRSGRRGPLPFESDEPAGVLGGAWGVEFGRASASQGADERLADYTLAGDDRLVGLLARRDVKALEVLYDRYGDFVYSVSLRVVGDVQLAEDIAQEVFLRLWRRPDLFDSQRGRFVTWLLSIARNRAIDERRSRGRRFRHETQPGIATEELLASAPVEDPADLAMLSNDRIVVQRALAVLPAAQRL